MPDKSQQKSDQITASQKKSLNNLVPFKTGFDIRRKNAGRKTKEHTFSDTAREMLASNHIEVTWTTEATGKKGSGEKTITIETKKSFYHHLVAVLIMEGMRGNMVAIRELINNTEGKLPIINQTNVTTVMGLRIGDSEELKDTKDVRGALAIIGDNWTATGA